MKVLVITKEKGIPILRTILYDIPKEKTLETIKETFYKENAKHENDTFICCETIDEINQVLEKYKLKRECSSYYVFLQQFEKTITREKALELCNNIITSTKEKIDKEQNGIFGKDIDATIMTEHFFQEECYNYIPIVVDMQKEIHKEVIEITILRHFANYQSTCAVAKFKEISNNTKKELQVTIDKIEKSTKGTILDILNDKDKFLVQGKEIPSIYKKTYQEKNRIPCPPKKGKSKWR